MTALLVSLLFMQANANPTGDVVALFEERTYIVPESSPARTLKYRLLKPAKIEPGKTYPVVLSLHGAGESGVDNVQQLKFLPEWMAGAEYREKYPCFLIAPQTQRGWAARRGPLGVSSANAAEPALAEAESAVGMLKECMKELPIDPSRVYLTGLSLGGYGTWATAAKYPELFAAVAPICGGGEPGWAERLKKLPIYAVHGDADPTVRIDQSRRMVEAVKAAGGNAKLKELPGVGHNSWTWAYKDPEGVIPWLFEQHK